MFKKINVAVIFGGRSGEHEVSLVSAESVMKNLDKNKYNIIPVGITKSGEWLTGNGAMEFLKNGKAGKFKKESITPDSLVNRLNDKNIDVVFPVLHGTFGEDGSLQGLLEMADVPYVGAGVLASSVAMDKIIQKMICSAEKILMPDWIWFAKSEWQSIKKSEPYFKKWVGGVEKRLGYPMFVKPANSGSSVGISKAHNRGELVKAIMTAIKYDRRVIIEKSVEGAMEIEVAVLGNNEPEASMVGRIIPSNEFYDYDAKYIDGQSAVEIPAKIPGAVAKRIQEIASQSYKLLDVAGMARVDFLVQRKGKNWGIYLSELNTIPGFTSISMYPKLWQATGLPYGQLLDVLIKLARERHEEKRKLERTYKAKREWHKAGSQ
jgi:D-alanine-D-alanine ligase